LIQFLQKSAKTRSEFLQPFAKTNPRPPTKQNKTKQNKQQQPTKMTTIKQPQATLASSPLRNRRCVLSSSFQHHPSSIILAVIGRCHPIKNQ